MSSTWIDPFDSFRISIHSNDLHGIEMGKQSHPGVVFLHGNPTWSFLYRNIMPPVARAGYHTLSYDHIGFGKSDKLPSLEQYTFGLHRSNFQEMLKRKQITSPVIVAHDWGGPIALSYALEFPERVRGLILINTNTFFEIPIEHQLFLLTSRNGIGTILYKQMNLFVEVLMRAGTYQTQRLRPRIMNEYRKPFPTSDTRAGILAFIRMVPQSRTHSSWAPLKNLHENISQITCPVLLIGGKHDPIFGEQSANTLQHRLPNTTKKILPRAGHYCQEDCPEKLAKLIRLFIDRRIRY